MSGGKKAILSPPARSLPSPSVPSPPTPSRFHKLLSYRRFLPSRCQSERHGWGPPPLPSLPPSHPPSPRPAGPRTQVSGRRLPFPFLLLPCDRPGIGMRGRCSLYTSLWEEEAPSRACCSCLRPTPAGPDLPRRVRLPFSLFSLPFPLLSLPRWPKWIPLLTIWRLPRPPPLCASAPSSTCSRGSEGEGPRQPQRVGGSMLGESLLP